MAGEKRFSTSLFGFGKSGVNSYIEKMLKEFDDKLKEKDNEIITLKNQYKDLRSRFEELSKRSEQINDDRSRIADVLIKAQEKAELIISDAKSKAVEEQKKIQNLVEIEKERLVDIKTEIRHLKQSIVEVLGNYSVQLDEMAGESSFLSDNLFTEQAAATQEE